MQSMRILSVRPRKIRQLTTNNKSGDAFGVTIPSFLKQEFQDVHFYIYVQGSNIILASGAYGEKSGT